MPMLVALVAVVLGICALVSCLRTAGSHVRGLPVAAWVAVIVLLPVVGPLAWFLAGRSHGGRPGPASPARGSAPKGPDDDEDFLRSLDRKDRGDL